MLQLNLLPDVKKDLLHARRMRNLVMTICIFVSIAAAAVVVVLALGLGALAIQKSVLSGEVDKNVAEIEKEKDDHLSEYLSVQNDLSLINSIIEEQPRLSRIFDYLDVIFGRTTPIAGLSWNDWTAIDLVTDSESGSGAVAIELSGTVDSLNSRLMLRNRLYYAVMKYSDYASDGSGKVVEGETKTDQKLFPSMTPTLDFEGGSQDEATGRYPFKVSLVFNPIAFSTEYRVQAIEVDSCVVWSATYGTIGDGCEDKTSSTGTTSTTGAEDQGGSQ